MKRRKWILSVAAALSLALAVTGCSTQGGNGAGGEEVIEPSENMNLTGFPIVNEPIQLSFLAGAAPTSNSNWNRVRLFTEYAKMTNINIEWQMVPTDALNERVNLLLASRDYPDAFHTARLTIADIMKHGGEGTFIPLNDLIDEYAPNFKKLLFENEDLRKGLTMPDGNIYSFPTYYDPDFTYVLVSSPLWLNETWLEQLGMDPPETTDEFYNYLKAVKTTDLNGNGVHDEIPYAGVKPDNLVNHLKGAWGLGNRGRSHAYVDVHPESGELRFIPTDPNYKEIMEYVHKLYSEGLLSEDIYTITSNEFYARGTEEQNYGSSIITSMETLMGLTNYVGAPALEGPHGDRIFSFYGSPLAAPGSFVITNNNPYPAETVRWIDYFYGDEGNLKFFMGWEGETYETLPDGTLQYTENITNSPDGRTLEQVLMQSLTWAGGSYPGIVKESTFKAALPAMVEAAERVAPYKPEEVWPAFSYMPDESQQMSQLLADIDVYVKEMQAKFITGGMDEWDRYVEQLNRMGLSDFMELYNTAYERYKEG